MMVERFLGGAWVAVHGPADPRRLPIWLLEAKFQGAMPAPGPRVVDWPAVRAAAADLPLRWPGVRAASPLRDVNALAPMASARDAEQQQAVAVLIDAAKLAGNLGKPRVVLDPGLVPVLGEIGNEDLGDPACQWNHERAAPLLARRKVGLNAALDRVCRVLHKLCKALPDVQFCLTPSRSLRTVGDLQGLEAIFEDLAQQKLGYWHDVAIVGRRHQVQLEAEGEWLEKFANRMVGISLGDASPDGLYLPPGAGGVDWALLAPYVRGHGKPLPAVLELDPAVDPGELPGVHSFLSKFGL